VTEQILSFGQIRSKEFAYLNKLPLKHALKGLVEDNKAVFALCGDLSHVSFSQAVGLHPLTANRTIQDVHSIKIPQI
jgi:hypothetical protein